MAEHVDEAWRHYFSLGVDGSLARRIVKIADGGDPAVANAYIAGVPWGASSIHNASVGNHQVKGQGRWAPLGLCTKDGCKDRCQT